MPILIMLATITISIALTLVTKLVNMMRDLIREPIRTLAKAIQYLAALAMLGATAFAIYCQWFNGPQMSGNTWALLVFSVIAAIAVIAAAQAFIDRPTRHEKRLQRYAAAMREPTATRDDPARYSEARRIWDQQQRYAAGDTRSQRQIVNDLQDNVNRVEALMRAADEAESNAKRLGQ